MTLSNQHAPQGLIFDCDGTLADTMPLHWQAWQVIVKRHRLNFPEERFYSLGGVPSRDIIAMLCKEKGRNSIAWFSRNVVNPSV
jgi:beta-phosphoglucomutase-like phosphatase (HAD superfamily)